MATKTQGILSGIGDEMKESPPKILGHTAEKFGPARAAKQRVAILLNKGRRAGARVPKPSGVKY